LRWPKPLNLGIVGFNFNVFIYLSIYLSSEVNTEEEERESTAISHSNENCKLI
jgi:hypothetical protein